MNGDQNLGGITALLWLPSGVILLASWLTGRGMERVKRIGMQRGMQKMAAEGKTHTVMLNWL